MLSKYRQKRQEGFTIIEVLIVLAIAGLILLVVFLAVPALQRNSRNTQRDNDVAGILGGMAEYVNNNNGQLPNATGTDGNTTVVLEDSTSSSENTVDVNLGYYAAGDVSIANAVPGTFPNEESVVVVTGFECDGTSPVAGSSRGYVALYTKEDSAQQCRES